MNTLTHLFDAAWKVLAVGLLLGAGLPALYAIGIRSLASGEGVGADGTAVKGNRNPLAIAFAGLCFALVVLAVVLGIVIIVSSGFGYKVSFENIYPTLVEK